MTVSEALPQAAESLESFAHRLLIDLHQAIIVQEQGVLIGDIAAIHNMRVAIRRLRVALSNFAVCLLREDRRRLRVQLENLSGALGKVRDLDVMIEALELLLPTRQVEDHPAIKSLIRRLKSRRRRQFRGLVNYLGGEEFANFKREFSLVEPAPQNIQPRGPTEHGQAAEGQKNFADR